MKKYVMMLLVSFFLLSGCQKTPTEPVEPEQTDALKFKEEYESYNGQANENNGKTYVDMTIAEDNPLVYATYEEVMNTLENSGVILLGFPTCPWCRMAIPVLLEACMNENISKVLYYNALDLRDTKELDKDGNIVTTKEADPHYTELLAKLGDYAEVYDGLNDPTVKRIYFPTVIVVNKGEIVLLHTSTIESQTDPYTAMTDAQHEELYGIYSEALKQLQKGCSLEQKC